MFGVVKLSPISIGNPPVASVYQYTLSLLLEANNVTDPLPHSLLAPVLVIACIVMVEVAEICNTGSPGIPPYSTI